MKCVYFRDCQSSKFCSFSIIFPSTDVDCRMPRHTSRTWQKILRLVLRWDFVIYLLYGQSMRINITEIFQQPLIHIDPKDSFKFHVVFYSRFVPKVALKCDPKGFFNCWHVADRIGLCQATSRSWSLERGASTSAESITDESKRVAGSSWNTWMKRRRISI